MSIAKWFEDNTAVAVTMVNNQEDYDYVHHHLPWLRVNLTVEPDEVESGTIVFVMQAVLEKEAPAP